MNISPDLIRHLSDTSDLEGHLNADHNFRLTDLMGTPWDEKLRMHYREHGLTAMVDDDQVVVVSAAGVVEDIIRAIEVTLGWEEADYPNQSDSAVRCSLALGKIEGLKTALNIARQHLTDVDS